jgi:malic enzyme
MRFRPAIDAATGEMYLPVLERGVQLLEEPLLNKGTAFSGEEREALGLRGLLPSHVSTMDEQLDRVAEQFHTKDSPIEKHIYLAGLHDRSETLFFRFVLENLEETVPIIYTPTVAEACSHWSEIFRQARGIYITPDDRGSMAKVLRSRGIREISVIVVTDNERILGIGDQGAGGMGIPIGKLALYTAAAGIHPSRCLPISLDFGTNNEDLLANPLYLGWKGKRIRGDEYWSLIEEFVAAVKEVFPTALLQWEDFANLTSFRNLETYRDSLPSFNDDIEGTAAMVIAGLMAAQRITGFGFGDHTYAIHGAGSAGTGIYRHLLAVMAEEGLDPDDAKRRILVTDSKGLLVEGRAGMEERKKDMAASKDAVRKLGLKGRDIGIAEVVELFRPSVLIGVCGHCGEFTEPMIKAMATETERPVVMPLSNPTSKTEAPPEDIIRWSDGRAIVATGSPFPEVVYDGKTHTIGQANNVYIFPGVGLGVIASHATKVTLGMFTAGAKALAEMVDDDILARGALFPPIDEVRGISRKVAHAVAEQAVAEGAARPCVDIEGVIDQMMWNPTYLPYRPA